jgi:heptose-I-phosphate ethanolaminephosphotransferase
MTSVVLKNVLCCNNVHENERWFDAPFFPAIFKKAGYDVWLWDNQYQQDHNYPWSFTLNSIMFNNTVKQLSYTSINDKGYQYDDDLVLDFEKNKLSKLGKHNLIIFHLWGQHLPADTQFPKNNKYKIFSIKDIKNKATYLNNDSRQVIADYDNATYYNDQVIRHIVNIFKDKNTILVYFPDHGEEVYDYQDSCGRQVFGEVEITPEHIKYQLEIPFTIWASETWKRKHEPEWMDMREYTDRAFTTDNICHMLFRLAGIKTKEYNNTRDLLDKDFIPQTKEYDIMSL